MSEPLPDLIRDLEIVAEMLAKIHLRREAARKAARFRPDGKLAPRRAQNRYLAKACHIREPIGRGKTELWIAGHPHDPDALNGYVAFPKRHAPSLPHGTGNIVQYIPVHGGVTYAVKDSYAAVWGFDTGHAHSDNVPRADPDYIRYQCHVLHHGLEVAAKLWPKFSRERSPEKRADMAQSLFEIDQAASGSTFERLGFEALFGMVFGGRIG